MFIILDGLEQVLTQKSDPACASGSGGCYFYNVSMEKRLFLNFQCLLLGTPWGALGAARSENTNIVEKHANTL